MKNPDYNLLDLEPCCVGSSTGRRLRSACWNSCGEPAATSPTACELPTQNIAISAQYSLLRIRLRHRSTQRTGPGSGTVRPRRSNDRVPGAVAGSLLLVRGRYPSYRVADLRTAKERGLERLEKLIADVPNGEQFFTTRHGEAIAPNLCSGSGSLARARARRL